MLFHCPTVQANFPAAKLRLVNRAPARLVWDEHGGTFVLRVEGLEVWKPRNSRGSRESGWGRPAGAGSPWPGKLRVSPGGTLCG